MNNFQNILLLGISTILSGAVNYAYHPIMLQFLDTSTFAEFESLISIFNILGVLVGGISFFLLKEISKNAHDLVKIKSIFVYSNKFLFIFSLGLYGLFVLGSPLIADYLKIEGVLALNLVGLTIIFSFLSVVINPILQGLERFKIQAVFGILSSIIKLGFGVAFVYLGYALFGAIAGFLMSGFILLFLSYFAMYLIFRGIDTDRSIVSKLKNDFLGDYKDIFASFFLVFLLSLYMNLDIIIAKSLFENDIAGMYAGVSVISKFLIFLGGTIETVYYPQIIKAGKQGSHFIRNGIAMMGILLIGSIAFFTIFGNLALEMLKSGFGAYREVLLLSLVYCGGYIVISFLSKILMGFRRYGVNWILAGGIVILFALTEFIPSLDIYQYLTFFLSIALILCVILGWLVWREMKKS